MSDTLSIWVVYGNATIEYPGVYVARRWLVMPVPGGPTDEVLTAETLEGLRERLPGGLICIGRQGRDLPEIVEVWV